MEKKESIMNTFKRINNLTGWVVFAIAATTYLLTIEPTASYWDCGEFIASSFKLEVGHPPGNPLFQMLGRFFSMFAAKEMVAPMINSMSALCSAFTILFLFWSITHLARRIIERKKETFTLANIIAIMGAGAVGSLVYTFSDSFWFSAVEAEVYAMSSLFTAMVFWAILRWEEEADKPYANRWIVLIVYLMGLSVGVHLLNLLAIPAIVLIYYFKKYAISAWGITKALLVSLVLLFITMQLIPGLPHIAGFFDLLFVNVFGMPFNSGAIFFIVLVFAILIYGMYFAYKKGKILWNTIYLCLTVFIIGFSSFVMVVIRSSANTPTNENQPDNMFSLLYYLNRDQYGSAPLLSGQTFATPPIDYKENYIYAKKDGKYVKIEGIGSYVYDPRYTMFFPRMHDGLDQRHVEFYKKYTTKGNGKIVATTKERMPTFRDNLAFFFDYQLGWMYWRYFMWNFAGRQNDIQGLGNSYHGNWECGISFIDKARLGNIDEMPPYLANHKSRNHYYMLPLLLGLCGLIYQLAKDKRNFFVIGVLFILTGVAIVIYLNQKPIEPRERDYAYVGSFYAFAMWIGLAVIALYDMFRRKIPAIASAIMASVLCILIPVQMGAINWDDHDRSNRYLARDMAYNYFMTCAPNAIIFTIGDNDTFPLWYLQEVEGIRTDVRVVNTSLLSADWYIDQMKCRQYESAPVPFKMPRNSYFGTNNYVHIDDKLQGAAYNLKAIMDFVANDQKEAKQMTTRGAFVDYLPTRRFMLPVNKENVLKNGTVRPEDADKIPDTLFISIPEQTRSGEKGKNGVLKSELMVLDLLANNDWERPIYFVSQGGDMELGLREYMQYDGFAYRLTPIRNTTRDPHGTLDKDAMYSRLMDIYRWGNINDPKIWLDYNCTYNVTAILNIRNMYSRTAQAFIDADENEKALALLDRVMDILPDKIVPYAGSNQNDHVMLSIIAGYYQAGQPDKANEIARRFLDETDENLSFYVDCKAGLDFELYNNLRNLRMFTMFSYLDEDLLSKAMELRQFYRTKMLQFGYSDTEYDSTF